MAENRFRLQVKFWLDLHKTEESELADLIAELKTQRTFSRVVRDGIRLMVDLWRGNLEVLLALFPWVEEAFYERFSGREPAPDTALAEQLARLERLLLEQGNVALPVLPRAGKPQAGGPKALVIPAIPGPVDEDDDADLLLVTKAKTSGNTAQNFLNSVLRLQQ